MNTIAAPNKRVLLVEDDSDVRQVFRMALEMNGYTVREATDGLDAIGQFQIDKFDLVLLDLAMPRIDGCGVIETLHKVRPGVPVIVVSAIHDTGVAERVRAAGALEFLGKPVAVETLVAAVKRYLP